jgi:hypothetical protein
MLAVFKPFSIFESEFSQVNIYSLCIKLTISQYIVDKRGLVHHTFPDRWFKRRGAQNGALQPSKK